MSAQPPRTPPLETGDRLTPKEFLRRYEAMPEVKKAELIEGVVYMPSPVNHKDHGGPHFNLIAWLGFYCTHTPGIDGGDNSTVKLKLGFNVPQPDGFLRILREFGGQSRIDSDGYIIGSPEWIGEVSASSASYDLHDKLGAYQRNGVQEYVVWRVLDRAIDWFTLRGSRFKRLPLANDGYYKSRTFPGVWLDPNAIIRGDMLKVLDILQKGLGTPDHRRFVETLSKWKQEHSKQ